MQAMPAVSLNRPYPSCSALAMLWYFVVAAWVPIYVVIYLLPRWL